jgi:hypothetical protein
MADKEKIAELLHDVDAKGFWRYSNGDDGHDMIAEDLADYLVENGVTIQRWIPVSERLPDTFGTFIVAVRIPTRKRTYSDSADFDPFAKKWTPSLFWGKGMDVTHWAPLPETPEERKDND